jgi:hypothetical protein
VPRRLDPEVRRVLLATEWGFQSVPATHRAAEQLIAFGLAENVHGYLTLTDLGRRFTDAELGGVEELPVPLPVSANGNRRGTSTG